MLHSIRHSSQARLQAPNSSLTKHVFLFGVLFLLFLSIFMQVCITMFSARGMFSLVGPLALALFSGISMATAAGCLTRGCIMAKMSEAEQADWALFFLSVVLPIVTRFTPLPTSDDSKANCIVTFAFLLRLGSLMDLSPALSLTQFIISFPIFTCVRVPCMPRSYLAEASERICLTT